MKIGEQYLCKEGCAGTGFSYSDGELVTIDARNISWCESLFNGGLLARAEVLKTAEEIQTAVDNKTTMDLTQVDGQPVFVAEKKRTRRRTSAKE